VSEALQEFAEKYDSPVLTRSIDLIKGEILSGGTISGVIDSLVTNLKKTKALRQEMVAATLTYMIFMAVIVIVIMPALFALSKQLLVILLQFGSKLSTTFQSAGTQNSLMKFSAANIDPFQFQVFSIFAIGIIAVFTSMIISTIEKGDLRGGIKYIPLFLVGAIIMYFVFNSILSSVMSGMQI
jgi:hypothetical protein